MNLSNFEIEQLNQAAASGCNEAKNALDEWAKSLYQSVMIPMSAAQTAATLAAVKSARPESSDAIPTLLPCPMCAGTAQTWFGSSNTAFPLGSVCVACEKCELTTRRRNIANDAIRDWNRRVPSGPEGTAEYIAAKYGRSMNDSLRAQRASDREKLATAIDMMPSTPSPEGHYVKRDEAAARIRTAQLD